MRRPGPALLAIVALSALAPATALTAPAAAAATKTCELPPVDGAGFYGLKVRGTSCATGKAIIRKMERGQTTAGSGQGRFSVRVDRRTWRCSTTFPAYEQAKNTCRSGERRVWLRSGA